MEQGALEKERLRDSVEHRSLGERAHYYKKYNLWRFERICSGGFQTAITHVTVKMAFSTVDFRTAGINQLLLAVILKNLH